MPSLASVPGRSQTECCPAAPSTISDDRFREILRMSNNLLSMSRDVKDVATEKVFELTGLREPLNEVCAKEEDPNAWLDKILRRQHQTAAVLEEIQAKLSQI